MTHVPRRPARAIERRCRGSSSSGSPWSSGSSALTARLFALQVVDGGRVHVARRGNRTIDPGHSVDARPDLRPHRRGRSSRTSPTFAVKVRPADLPSRAATRSSSACRALIGMRSAEINVAIDSNPGSRFDPVRVAQDVAQGDREPHRRGRLELPGVEVVVESRRDYAHGPLLVPVLGYTGPISQRAARGAEARGLSARTTSWARRASRRPTRSDLRGTYGAETRRTRRVRPQAPGAPDRQRGRCRQLAPAHDRHAGAGAGARRRSSGACRPPASSAASSSS